MIALAVAGLITIAWGYSRYVGMPPWETLCSGRELEGPPSEPVFAAVLLPWLLLLGLTCLGLLAYLLRVTYWPKPRRRPFKVVGSLSWLLVILLNPMSAALWAVAESAGICWS